MRSFGYAQIGEWCVLAAPSSDELILLKIFANVKRIFAQHLLSALLVKLQISEHNLLS